MLNELVSMNFDRTSRLARRLLGSNLPNRGYRGQQGDKIYITKGIFATEGEGVYIALDPGLAEELGGHAGGYLLELEFRLNNPIRVREPLYILNEADELEEPIDYGDSDWLKASKLAYQGAMEKHHSWSEAHNFLGHFLTRALKSWGYDGVWIDSSPDDKWVVVFNPGNVKIIKAQLL